MSSILSLPSFWVSAWFFLFILTVCSLLLQFLCLPIVSLIILLLSCNLFSFTPLPLCWQVHLDFLYKYWYFRPHAVACFALRLVQVIRLFLDYMVCTFPIELNQMFVESKEKMVTIKCQQAEGVTQ